MPAMMISEMPLPIPRSVMRSPSHMMKQVPVVSDSTLMARNANPGSMTTASPPGARMLSRPMAIAVPWMRESPIVPYRVYCVIF